MNFNVCNVFNSQNSHQNVPAVIPAIFRVILLLLLLQEHKSTNVVSGVAVIL